MKRFLAFVLLFVFLICGCVDIFAETATNDEAELYEVTPADFSVDAKSALLMDANTGKILYAQNEKEAASPASVTKIMTLLLVMEAVESGRITLDDKVSISANAASMGGSQVFLEEGEQFCVRDLIKCTVIASANDAAVALSETVCGSEEAFVRLMNDRARELGLENTCFENCTGLDDTTKNHVTSALDIALMSRELLKHGIITEYSSLWQDSIRDGEFVLTNTNRLVRYYDGCNGLKTGSTDKAGFCISATAKRNGMQLIAVVMGAETRDKRNEIARSLLDYGFANYAVFFENESEIECVPVYSGTKDEVLVYSKAFSAVINKADLSAVVKQYDIPECLSAPIQEGSCVGRIIYLINGRKLGEVDIYVKESIDKISIPKLFVKILQSILTGSAKNEE